MFIFFLTLFVGSGTASTTSAYFLLVVNISTLLLLTSGSSSLRTVGENVDVAVVGELALAVPVEGDRGDVVEYVGVLIT